MQCHVTDSQETKAFMLVVESKTLEDEPPTERGQRLPTCSTRVKEA